MPKQITFTEPRTWRGHWWLPGNTKDVVSGVLSYDPASGLRLELIGDLVPRGTRAEVATGVEWTFTGDANEPVLVHGRTESGPVTLVRCSDGGSSSNWGQFGSWEEQNLTPEFAFIGAHLDPEVDELFRTIECQVDGLTRWAGQSSMSIEFSGVKPKAITPKFPEDLRALCGDDATGKYEVLLTSWISGFNPTSDWQGTSASISHEKRLVVTSKVPRTWAQLHEQVSPVIELVALALRRSVQLRSLRLNVRPLANVRKNPLGSGWVDVLWRQPSRSPTPLGDAAFQAARVRFGPILRHWTARRSKLLNAFHLLQATWSGTWYLEQSVLALATAVESLGSSICTQTKMSEDEFGDLVDHLVGSAPAECRQWVRGCLQHANGPSTRQRAKAVANSLPEEVLDRLGIKPKTWANVLVNARNDLSHGGSTEVTFEKLASLRQATSAIVYMALLNALGIGASEQVRMLDGDSYLRYACTLGRRDFG